MAGKRRKRTLYSDYHYLIGYLWLEEVQRLPLIQNEHFEAEEIL
jgi:hypothetical protein